MFTGIKRKNESRRPVHPLVWILCGLIAGIGVGAFVMHARTPEEPPQSAVQALVESVSPLEIQQAEIAPVPVDMVPLEIPVITAENTLDCKVVLVRTGEHFCTIQAAIDAASDALDVVLVGDGVYEENLLIENRSVTLRGEGSPVLDPISAATIRVNQGSLLISDFTIRGHDTGIYITSADHQGVTVQNVTFQINPLQGFGYGIMLEGGRDAMLNVSNSTFQVGGTAVEIDGGKQHALNFAGVVFQMPNIVMHVSDGKRHQISFTPDVAFQTTSTTLSVERSRHITINAQNVIIPANSLDLHGDATSIIYR